MAASPKRILVFGDSNSWGYMPGRAERYGPDIRWPKRVARALGPDIEVIEENLCGRTSRFDDPGMPGRHGGAVLPVVLESQAPLDMVILMLGTNDFQSHLNASAAQSAEGIAMMVKIIKNFAGFPCQPQAAEILVASPVLISEISEIFEPGMMKDGEAKSRELAGQLKAMARAENCYFIDTTTLAAPSPIDGVHLDEAGHKALGAAMTDKLREIFEL